MEFDETDSEDEKSSNSSDSKDMTKSVITRQSSIIDEVMQRLKKAPYEDAITCFRKIYNHESP